MAIQSGTHLGPYEILSAIGAGGMGEVYRARDPKLGRNVAIKVLPEAFARDADRMARFQREAKVLASLDHPNIATIHGLEESGGTRALVMQLVEGPTLADRIKQGPIPVDEAVRIARQIADALEYAHERGIVHRDLKPANIKVTADDVVKVLDFGLAKALEGDPASIDISTSPTISRMATMAGILLGTAAYMSPEQAKAKPVDRRADIWAFGCVLYEMLTGEVAFHGETVTDTLAAVIMKDPDWSHLPAATPMRVRVLLQRCLQKDPKQRLQAIGDARISLDEVLSGAPDLALAGTARISAPLWRRAIPWAVSGALAIALAALGWAYLRVINAPAQAEPVRFEIPVPEKAALVPPGTFALSPDGRQLAFAATGSDGVPHLWVRNLGSVEALPLSGSELPSGGFPPPFWSPDSRYIAFSSGGKLKKIEVSSGAVEILCDAPQFVVGGSWNRDGVIIFGSGGGPIMRVSANGGTASPATTLNSSRGETEHVIPSFLPDGRHFLYHRTSRVGGNSGIYVGSLNVRPEQQDSKRLLATDYGVIYVPSSDPDSGQLLFVRDATLMAQEFDARRLELSGAPVPLVEHVGTYSDAGLFSASSNGILVYTSGGFEGEQLTLFDRQGKILGTTGEPGRYGYVALSPDGRRVVADRQNLQSGSENLWMIDLARGISTRFTFDSSTDIEPVWSPDGSRLAFASNRSGRYDIYQKLSNGGGEDELLFKSDNDTIPLSWSGDGRFLIFGEGDVAAGTSSVLPLDGIAHAAGKPFLFVQKGLGIDEKFSPGPQGRSLWVAYSSKESSRYEIYVRPFDPHSPTGTPPGGGKWQVSTEGGASPRWNGNGKELFYVAPDGTVMSVEVSGSNGVFQSGTPKPLFKPKGLAPQPIAYFYWDASSDGKKFIFAVSPSASGAAPPKPFNVVLNWTSLLKK